MDGAHMLKILPSREEDRFDLYKLLRDFHCQGDASIICKSKDDPEQTVCIQTSKHLLAASSSMLLETFKDVNKDGSIVVTLCDENQETVENLINLLVNGMVECRDQESLNSLNNLVANTGVHVGSSIAHKWQGNPPPVRQVRVQKCYVQLATAAHFPILKIEDNSLKSPPPKKKLRVIEKKKYVCKSCNEEVLGWPDIILHLEQHIDRKVTESALSSGHELKRFEFENRMENQCKYCAKPFGAPSFLVSHLENHNQSCHARESQACSSCKFKCQTLGDLFFHQRQHEMAAWRKCNVCGIRLRNSIALSLHMTNRHPEIPVFKPKFRCSMCEKVFKSSKTLKVHERSHDENEPFKICEICGFKAKRKDSLAYHMQTHLEVKKYRCDFAGCGQSFAIKYLLDNHIKKHNGETPYLCDICGQGFTFAAHMKSHKSLVHNRYFTFQCTICSLKLKSRQNARKHILIHSDIKPYHCSFCKMTFSYQSEIEKHRKKGHDGQKFMIKKVMLPIHHEMIEKAIKPIPPEPIPGDFKMAQNCNKAIIKEIRGKKYSMKLLQEAANSKNMPVSNHLLHE